MLVIFQGWQAPTEKYSINFVQMMNISSHL